MVFIDLSVVSTKEAVCCCAHAARLGHGKLGGYF